MKNIYLILIAIFFVACTNDSTEKTEEKPVKEEKTQKVKIQNDLGFIIEQKKEYINPDFDVKKLKRADNIGPHNGKTFIDDPDISTIDDLNKYYQLPQGYKFAVAKYKESKNQQPVIVDPDEKLYSFIIEDEYLMYDKKIITEKDGKKYIDWDTKEIQKKK